MLGDDTIQLSNGSKEYIHMMYYRSDEPELIFYRVSRNFGFGVKIQEQTTEDNKSYRTEVLIPQGIAEELSRLCDEVKNTRAGDMVWSAGYGAPHHIRQLRGRDQVYPWPGCEKINATPKVPQQVLDECFMKAYEHVDGYRPYGNDTPELDSLYDSLKEQGMISINPEGMAIILHKGLHELLQIC